MIYKMKKKMKNFQQNQEGNALFLILIAVTLFAALSYAVTQSNRSSGGNSNEGSLVSASSVTQYPAGVRTGIMRMMIRGVVPDNLDFALPTDSSFQSANSSQARNYVFHPEGGGVAYQEPDSSMVNTAGTAWLFNTNTSLPSVGVDSIPDIVALLVDIPFGVCRNINSQLTGLQGVPASGLASTAFVTGTTAITIPDVAATATAPATTARPFLCIETTDSKYVYYHALVEQ